MNWIFAIHGICQTGNFWSPWTDFFCQKGLIVEHPTLPYHNAHQGDRPPIELGSSTLGFYARWLEKHLETLIDEHNGPPHIIAHSMGARLAEPLAAKGMAKSLVMLNPPPTGIRALWPPIAYEWKRVMTRLGWWRRPVLPSFREFRESMLNMVPDDRHEELYKECVYDSGLALLGIALDGFPKYKQLPRFTWRDIKCPVRIATGGDDKISVPWLINWEHKRLGLRESDFLVLGKHAHFIPYERGGMEVAEMIYNKWLQ